MSPDRQIRTPDEMARQWQSLAERRRQHLLELYRTGRWRRYYTEDSLMAQMRETVRGIEGWGTLTHPDGEPEEAPTPSKPPAEG
jgi:uncharacterized repeat protein (TIGR03809 family)